jgi:eukaryotic translation initiation factor 2-alpha kinase 4
VFDIITQDLESGPIAATAEAISIVNDCLESFANLEKYDIHLSHTKSMFVWVPCLRVLTCPSVYDALFEQVPPHLQPEVLKILVQSNASPSQRRQLLAEKGLSRSFVDSLEILSDRGESFLVACLPYWSYSGSMLLDADVDELLARLDRVSPTLVLTIFQAVQEIKSTMHFAAATGVVRTIYFHPLFMLRNPSNVFEGLCFEVVKRQQPHQKKSDTLAMGGR